MEEEGRKMNAFKKDLILMTGADISKFLLERHGVEVDELDLAELIRYNLSDFIEDPLDEIEYYEEEDEE